MKVSDRTIEAIKIIILGDCNSSGKCLSPYKSGPILVKFFNKVGFNDEYGQGFPSRWEFVEEHLQELNGTEDLEKIIQEVCDPREFMDSEYRMDDALEYLNKRLKYDGYKIIIDNGLARIKNLKNPIVKCPEIPLNLRKDGHIFIREQLKKSENKIQNGDYDGAITNARSLMEAVLKEIEKQYNQNPPRYDGKIIKLYKRVQNHINLNPANNDINNSLKQILTGLISIVNGLASISDRMGDRHAREYKPSKHHALLAVNAARTFTQFIFDTNEFQTKLK